MEMNTAEGAGIVEIELSYKGSGMSPYSAYYYRLRVDNGNVLFDARVYAGRKSSELLTVKNATISGEAIADVVDICGGIAALQGLRDIPEPSPNPIPSPVFVTDGPHHPEIWKVLWDNGTSIRKAPPNDHCKVVLFQYLRMLTFQLALPPAEGNMVAMSIYGKRQHGQFSYGMEPYLGNLTFHTVYTSQDGERMTPPRAVIAEQDMQALQDICNAYALAEVQHTYKPALPAGYTQGDYVYHYYCYIEVHWENGAILEAHSAFGAEAELESFFRQIALRLEDQQAAEV